MDTQFLICLNCKTIFEVPSRNRNSGIVDNIVKSYNFKTAYAFYNSVLPPCCNKPERKWAYDKEIKRGLFFPRASSYLTEEVCLSFIKKNKLKYINMRKEYPDLISNVEVACEL